MLKTEMTDQSKLAYSVDEIHRRTTLSKAFLRNEIRAGKLKATRFGRRVLVLTADLERYLSAPACSERVVAE